MRTLLTYFAYFVLVTVGVLGARRLTQARAGRVDAATASLLGGLGAGMFFISEPRHLFEDFADAYYAGGAAVLEGRSIESLFANGVHGFVNVPILAYVFVPLAVFPVKFAGVLYAAAGVLATAYTYVLLLRNFRLDALAKALLLLAFLANGPLMNSLREGNTSHFALLAVTLALLELRRGRDLNAGLLIGFAALFKLPLLVFGAYFVARRRFRAALGGALVLLGAGALSLAVAGLGAHVTWYTEFVGAAGKNPVAAFNVQSFASLIARLVRGEGLCDWNGQPLPALGQKVASALSLSLYLAALGAVLVRRAKLGRAPTSRELEVEFLVVLMLACTTSPLAWSHYYVWCLLPIAYLLEQSAEVLRTRASRAVAWGASVAVCLPVVWPFCVVPGWLAAPYAILVSHYLLGGVALFGLLIRERWRLGGLPGSESSDSG